MISKKENTGVVVAKIIGGNIERLRINARLSRRDLAGLIGVTYQQLYKYETGQNIVSSEMIVYLKFCLSADSYNEFFRDLF